MVTSNNFFRTKLAYYAHTLSHGAVPLLIFCHFLPLGYFFSLTMKIILREEKDTSATRREPEFEGERVDWACTD